MKAPTTMKPKAEKKTTTNVLTGKDQSQMDWHAEQS